MGNSHRVPFFNNQSFGWQKSVLNTVLFDRSHVFSVVIKALHSDKPIDLLFLQIACLTSQQMQELTEAIRLCSQESFKHIALHISQSEFDFSALFSALAVKVKSVRLSFDFRPEEIETKRMMLEYVALLLRNSSKLQELALDGKSLSDSDLELILDCKKGLGANSSVKMSTLTLSLKNMTDVGAATVRKLLIENAHPISKLELEGLTSLSSSGVKLITSAVENTLESLKILKMSWNGLDSTSFLHSSTIFSLNLASSDECKDFGGVISSLKQVESLEKLELNGFVPAHWDFINEFQLKVLKIGDSNEVIDASRLSSNTLEELEIKLIRPEGFDLVSLLEKNKRLQILTLNVLQWSWGSPWEK
jgi:hypothetical protein